MSAILFCVLFCDELTATDSYFLPPPLCRVVVVDDLDNFVSEDEHSKQPSLHLFFHFFNELSRCGKLFFKMIGKSLALSFR